MKVKVRCSKLECREDIHFKTQPGPIAKNATLKMYILTTFQFTTPYINFHLLITSVNAKY